MLRCLCRTSGQAQLFLDSVTLILPDPDYQVLATAAARGQSWQQQQSDLVKGLSALSVAVAPDARTNTTVLSQLVGWGVNATNLKIVSDGKVMRAHCTRQQHVLCAECNPGIAE